MAITLSCIDEIDYGASGLHTLTPKFPNTTRLFACCKRNRGALSLGADSRVNGKSLTLKLTWIYGEQALRVEHYGLHKCPKLYSS